MSELRVPDILQAVCSAQQFFRDQLRYLQCQDRNIQ